MTAITPIKEWRGVDRGVFQNEIFPAAQPAVMRGLLADWPAVRAGRQSPSETCAYLSQYDRGAVVEHFLGPPSIKGRFWYRDDLQGLNFERRNEPLRASIDRLLAHLNDPEPPAIYAGAVSVTETMPGFARDNVMPLIDSAVTPRIWLGNQVLISTHFDVSDNIACIVSGRRRVTVFPPEQLPNLYVGPLEFTIAGQPASMVEVRNADHEKYPRYQEALAQAQTVDLAPGDALYIPYMWWHTIESLDRFNVLVNYWWDDSPLESSPFVALIHAIMAVRDLPAHRRAQWRAFFDHYVFDADETTAAHLPPQVQGILGPMNPARSRLMKGFLQRALNPPK